MAVLPYGLLLFSPTPPPPAHLTSISDTLRRTVRYLCHLHHRCGYGIQSPYAYSMVRDVVYERGTYYAYAALDALVAATPQAALRPTDYRLLFRLANAAGVRRMAVWAAEAEVPVVTACVRAACPAAQPADDADEALQWAYIDAAALDAEALHRRLAEADRRAADGALVVVARPPRGLRRRIGRQMPPRCRVVFDLHDMLILSYEQRLQRQHYRVCYF